MSMDALTNAALENLQKNSLSKLVAAINALHTLHIDQRSPNKDLAQIIRETCDLLEIIEKWSKIQESNSVATANTISENLSPDDEIMLANALECDAMAEDPLNTLGSEIEITMGDDPIEDDSHHSEMSDDEARKLLNAMDAPLETQESSSNSTEEISDEEARKLLADMDAPAASADNDMSDDEARKILAAMDAPVESTVPPNTKSVNSNSADDDAIAMLAAIGGLDTNEASATKAPSPARMTAPVIKNAPSASHDHDGEHGKDDIGEIAEWESNDFASDPEMMNDFTTNSSDIMQKLDDTVLQLEQDPTNKETIEEIFRAAHTLKGAAGMFGFRAIERVMHRMENLFDNVRKGKLVPNSDTIDAVFIGLDCLKKLLAAVLAQTPSGIKTAPVVRMLELASNGKPSGASRSGASASSHNEAAQQTASAPASHDEHGGAPTSSGGGAGVKKKNEAASTIRVDLERLDALVNLIGELVIDRTRFVNIEDSLRIQAPQLKLAGSMTETLQQFGRHMNEIQDIIMKIRMVPVGSVFNKYPRIVRDLARQLGKQIDLVIDGEETEFDKTLVEQIADPLVHLIRNACDHGIEMPNDRTSAGKKPNGTVTLSAKQEGNHILILISDDGKGMDVNRIKAKGIEKGLITADQNLSDRDIFNLIFEPGFSTADKVTTVSGRGVGMDVVKKQIAKLKGMVEINSAPGKGSTITIQLPLTLAIMQSLLVGVQEEVLAIPLSSVVESIRIKPSEIQTVGDSEVIKLRDTVLPLRYLDDILGLEIKSEQYWYRHADQVAYQSVVQKRRAKRSERMYVVVVGTAERRYGLVVDALLNQQEMVIKPLGSLMRDTPCVAGGAVLGNGEVVLVMDIPEIENHYRSKKRGQIAA